MIKKLITVAEGELGYTESPRNSNKTKYWQDINPKMNGNPWCQCFINWLFVKSFGKDKARTLLHQPSWTYYTPTASDYFKKANEWHTVPEVGSIVYFKNTTRICHVGLVTEVTPNTITTIEGNTVSNGFDSNGGMVCKKTYKRTYYGIAGYATPSYIEETTNEQVSGNFGASLGQVSGNFGASLGQVSGNSGATLKSNEEIAEECIKGLWGNGNSRKSKLTKAGYDYEAIRAIINNKLKGGKK